MPLINDVTGLNPINVNKVLTPETIQDLQSVLQKYDGPVSIGGGRFSMGGQIGSDDSLHIDMRSLNRILEFNPQEKTIRVQAGIRWRDIQKVIDPHHLSIKIMQTYSNFTVGGSLSVNSHGRYIGQGPLILSVRSLQLLMSDGNLVEASPDVNSSLFYGVIGGYGGLGIIVEATLNLVDNTVLERQDKKLKSSEYLKYFFENVRNKEEAIFHNGDLYPPHYQSVRAITWSVTDKSPTVKQRVYKKRKSYAIERYFVWAITSTFSGNWRREHLLDPTLYLFPKRAWRNFEAGNYDVAELEPRSRKRNTYVLQEYFVPVRRFDEFVPKIADILQRYKVNVLNISIRHAKADSGSLMAWAREEVFAFVLYYKQKTNEAAKGKVAIWTRELIEAVLSVNGTYYLPYQLHATHEQFHRAYPKAKEYFTLKNQWDPNNKLRNKLWDKYYFSQEQLASSDSEFQHIFKNTHWRDKFYLFLQNVYNIYPEHEFHFLIQQACEKFQTDQEIYTYIQNNLGKLKPVLADFRYAIPALMKQKREMARQTKELLNDKTTINGYLEIGTSGRYVNALKKRLALRGPIYLMPEQAPTLSPIDIVERGQLNKIGRYHLLGDYQPIPENFIASECLDLVTCFIGLHHAPLNNLDQFVRSIHRILRKGGRFIVRDHDVYDATMFKFVSLVHTVFNAGLNVSWENNCKELRHFTALNDLIAYLKARGFKYSGKKLLQAHDPSLNTLLEFEKI